MDWSQRSSMAYNEEDFLQLSGLQHFLFCRRQWALIHVEGLWAENVRTIDGKLLHENAHDAAYVERRKDRLITRAVRVFSATLGISGECDVVEYFQSPEGIPLPQRDGLWKPYPIEYKRGEPGAHTEADAFQLCAQALCLEEMLCCEIPEGALYYGMTHHRKEIRFTEEMRTQVKAALEEMHSLVARGCTPKVRPTKSCNACSMKELCLPKMMKEKSVVSYMRGKVEDLP